MPSVRRVEFFLVLGVVLASLFCLTWSRPEAELLVPMPAPPPSRSGSPFQEALREARWSWGQAMRAVKPALEAELEADPGSSDSQEARRQRLVMRDHSGFLRRARGAARRSVALAQTPAESYQARYWLALLECDSGHHVTEFRLAQWLMAREPRNGLSILSLRRAARCTGREELEQRAELALEIFDGRSDPSGGRPEGE